MIEITKITTDFIKPKDSGICGEFSIVLNNSICIHKIHVIQGRNGLFIAFPNTGEMKLYKRSKKYLDIVHPTNKTLREKIEREVLMKYNNEIENL